MLKENCLDKTQQILAPLRNNFAIMIAKKSTEKWKWKLKNINFLKWQAQQIFEIGKKIAGQFI